MRIIEIALGLIILFPVGLVIFGALKAVIETKKERLENDAYSDSLDDGITYKNK